MSGARTTVFELNGQRYQLSKMDPVIGGFLWQKFVAAGFKASLSFKMAEFTSSEVTDAPEVTPEHRTRSAVAIGLTQFSLEDYRQLVKETMNVVRRLTSLESASEVPMPVRSDDGRWAFPDLAEDPMAVTRLMTEALVFNLTSFLD